MENYEQKYQEALERARKELKEYVHKDCDDMTRRTAITTIYNLFPELAESEDERIRKEIIDFLKLPHPQFVGKRNHKKWIAWLENQCNKQGKSALEVWKDMRLEVYQQASGNRHEPNCSDDSTKMFSLNDIDEIIEKISEQSHDDKIKPKFHEGDWIISNNKKSIYQVIEVKRGIYVIRDNVDNHVYHIGIEECEKSGRLWSINDAKDGDVLAINWNENDDSFEKIIIFKKYHNKGVKGLYSMPCVEGYGNTFKNGKLAFQEEIPYYSETWTANLHPATKEQRDMLFEKIKNAGYEWDAEKKKLNSLLDSFPVKPLKEK